MSPQPSRAERRTLQVVDPPVAGVIGTPEHADAGAPEITAREGRQRPASLDPSDADHSSTRGAGGEPPKPSLIRRHPFAFLLAFLLVIGAAIGGYFYWQYAKQFEETDDAFVESRPFALAPKVNGYVTEVLVSDNQHVEAGQPLLKIDPRDYQVSLEQAEAQMEAAQAQVAVYDAQISAQGAQIAQAEAQVNQAKAALQFADADAKRYQELLQKGAGTLQKSQQTTTDQQQREADLARAQGALTGAKLQIDVLRAQRKNAAASVAQAKAQVDTARLNLSYTTLTALQPGTIAKLSAAVGQFAASGLQVAMLVPDRVWVTANYKETQLTDMRPGQPAELRIDAYPDRTIHGHVDSIQRGSGTAFSLLPAENATGNYVKVVQRVPVKIVADDWPADVAIGPGMSVIPNVRVR